MPAIVLTPDQFAVNRGDWLDIARLRPPRDKPDYVHVSYLEEEDEPWVVRCRPARARPRKAEAERRLPAP